MQTARQMDFPNLAQQSERYSKTERLHAAISSMEIPPACFLTKGRYGDDEITVL